MCLSKKEELWDKSLKRLSSAIERNTLKSGDLNTSIPSLNLYRRNAPTEPLPCIYSLSLGLVVQGNKQILFGDKIINYGSGELLITTIDVPVITHVTKASNHEPFLALVIDIDYKLLIQIMNEIKKPQLQKKLAFESVSVYKSEQVLLDVICRLVEVLDEPLLIKQLAPLFLQEIHIRLISGVYGNMLQNLIIKETPEQQILSSIIWIKQNFTKTINIDEIAENANMSPSSFRKHFRNITGTSPLQYQKQLRIQESRQLMLNKGYNSNEVSNLVGYQSVSQFNREYKRILGMPPYRDIQQLKI
ncbi:MAG: AraC family transcriptional regulator [Candidatus Sericytochromatia bacterium]